MNPPPRPVPQSGLSCDDTPHAGAIAGSDPRWQQVLQRTAGPQDFVYGVRSTGVFCRPGCPSRVPLRRNVEFFANAGQAQAGGYRACLRCDPEQSATLPALSRVAGACRAMLVAGGPLAAAGLERVSWCSSRQLERDFDALLGVGPRQFGAAVRVGRARDLLQSAGSVAEAVYSAGFGSARGFYDGVGPTLGMPPAAYRTGADGLLLRWTGVETAIGQIVAAASDYGLAAVRIREPGAPAEAEAGVRAEFPYARLQRADGELGHVRTALAALARGDQAAELLPTDVRATAFQARVWAALRRIPAGQTSSYSQVAAQIGAARATRAVANACARNPVALIVPCHRVIRGDGSLGGYRWGLSVKAELLAAEVAAHGAPSGAAELPAADARLSLTP